MNKTYRVQILDSDREPIPNSYKEEINDSIKPIEKEKANAEIEIGEIVFNPQNMMLHRAGGKKHSKGGTPVHLKEGSFIFSDFKKLGVTKDEIEEMEFKKGGVYKPTPANVLKKEVDIKHHNHMVNILSNEKKHDSITNASANLMIAKNLEKIGQVAFVQEKKKQFPDGQPTFSEGTAPVYSDLMNESIIRAGQFNSLGDGNTVSDIHKYKTGGNLRKFVPGGQFACPCGVDPNGKCIECPPEEVDKFLPKAQLTTQVPTNYQYVGTNKANQKLYYNGVQKPGVTGKQDPNWKQTFANLSEARKNEIRKLAATKGTTVDNYMYTNPDAVLKPQPFVPQALITPERTPPSLGITPRPPQGNQPNTVGYRVEATNYKTPLTAWQKANIGIDAFRGSTVKTYMPLRQHQESVVATPELYDAQPLMNNVNQSYFNAAQQNRLNVNPAMAVAANEALAGNRLDGINQAVGQTQERNVGIINNYKANVAGTLNNDAAANRAFDSKYKEQSDTALQNRDDMRDFLNNRALSTANTYIAQNQAFNSQLNQQQQYKTSERIGTDADGTPVYRGAALYSPTSNGFGYSTRLTPNLDVDITKLQGAAGTNNISTMIYAQIEENTKLRNAATDSKSKAIYSSNIARLISQLNKQS